MNLTENSNTCSQHNPFKLPLSAHGIFLKRKRPLFFCERILLEADAAAESGQAPVMNQNAPNNQNPLQCVHRLFWGWTQPGPDFHIDASLSRSAVALLGTFRNFEEGESETNLSGQGVEDEPGREYSMDSIVASAIEEAKWSDRVRNLFQAFDLDNDGFLTEEEYIQGWNRIHPGQLTEGELHCLFEMADQGGTGALDYEEFHKLLLNSADFAMGAVKAPPSHRDDRGLIRIEPSREKYFGELLRKYNKGKSGKTLDFSVTRSQEQAMQLYESRIGSLQRFVSMVVMFHQMGRRVERFFSNISFGLLAYRMDRTHSIMRIATTASPVSGADVRQQMYQLRVLEEVKISVRVISTAWLRYKAREKVRVLAHNLSSSEGSTHMPAV